jgi:uncharacterized membrane protein
MDPSGTPSDPVDPSAPNPGFGASSPPIPPSVANDPRLDDIEARLSRIENRLGIMRVPTRRQSQDPVVESAASPAPQSRAPSVVRASPPQSPPRAPMPQRASKPSRPLNLERLFGERVIAWVGAIIVVIGVGLFVKLAYDNGWLRFPPYTRCLLGAGFGAALLVAGEFIRRRIGAVAGAGCLAAGIGTMYASAFAAHELYQLVPLEATFAMLAAVSALGIVIAVASRLASVGAVGLIGAYLTPLLLWRTIPGPYLTPGYLLILLAAATILAARIGGRFGVMRWIGWIGTLLLGTAWSMSNGHPILVVMTFLVGVWLIVQAGVVLAAPNADTATDADTRRMAARELVARVTGICASFAAVGWATVLGMVVVAERHEGSEWIVAAGFGLLSLGGAAVAAGSLRVIESGTPSGRAAVGVAMVAQAGALALLAVGSALDGPALVLTWLAMGVGAVVAAWRLRQWGVGLYGVVSISLATAMLLVYEPTMGRLMDFGTPFHGLIVSKWMWCTLAAAGAWLIAGRALKPLAHPLMTHASRAALVIGPALTFVAFLHDDVHEDALAWAWIGVSTFWLAARGLIGKEAMAWVAITSGFAIAMPWLLAYPRDWFASAAILGLHPGLWSALAMGSILLVASRIGPRGLHENSDSRVPYVIACVAAALLIVLVATSYEAARIASAVSGVAHAKASAVSIWWAVCGSALVAGGLAVKRANLRHAGLALLYIAGAKVVIYDFQNVAPSWRIAAFIGIGLLMLIVGIGYAKVSRSIERRNEVHSPDAEPV